MFWVPLQVQEGSKPRANTTLGSVQHQLLVDQSPRHSPVQDLLGEALPPVPGEDTAQIPAPQIPVAFQSGLVEGSW